MMSAIAHIHLAGFSRGGCRPVHKQAVLCMGPASVGVSRILAHKDGTCGLRGRERGNPRSATISHPGAPDLAPVPVRDGSVARCLVTGAGGSAKGLSRPFSGVAA